MDFRNMTAYLDSLLDLGVPSLDLAIHKDHELIYRHMAGARSPEGAPLT